MHKPRKTTTGKPHAEKEMKNNFFHLGEKSIRAIDAVPYRDKVFSFTVALRELLRKNRQPFGNKEFIEWLDKYGKKFDPETKKAFFEAVNVLKEGRAEEILKGRKK